MSYNLAKARISAAAVALCLFASGCSYATTTLVIAALAGAAQGYADSQANTLPSDESASAGRGLLTTETVSDLTKQCVYNHAGSVHVRTVKSYEVCPLSISIPQGSSSGAANSPQSTNANTLTGFFKREIDTGGLTKQCIYDVLGSTYTLTVKSYEVCMPTAKFKR